MWEEMPRIRSHKLVQVGSGTLLVQFPWVVEAVIICGLGLGPFWAVWSWAMHLTNLSESQFPLLWMGMQEEFFGELWSAVNELE